MAYVPLNVNVYAAAFAGAMAGINIPNGAFITDPNTADYAAQTNVAAAFAAAVDTAWGNITVPNTYDIAAIENASNNTFTRGAGFPFNATLTSQANWTRVATALVVMVLQGDVNASGSGIILPPTGIISPSNILYVIPNNGMIKNGSLSNPFSTITQATNVATPNTTICVAPGTYNEDIHLTTRQNLICMVTLPSSTTFPVGQGQFWPIVINGDIYVNLPNGLGNETIVGISDVYARNVHITANIDSTFNSLRCRRCWFNDIDANHVVNVRIQGTVPPYAGSADCAVRTFLGGTIDVEAYNMYWGLAQDGSFGGASDVKDFQLIGSFLIITPTTVITAKSFSTIVDSLSFSATSPTGVPNVAFTDPNKTLQLFGWSSQVTVSGPGASIGNSGVYWNNGLANLAYTVLSPVNVTGAKAGNAALTSLVTQLASLGIITNNTT